MMVKRTKHVCFEAGLILAGIIAFTAAAYAKDESGTSDSGTAIMVTMPDDPHHVIKLRPFVPNRQLPSRAQLEALQEEKAKAGQSSQSTLSGRISAFSQPESNTDLYTDININQHRNHKSNKVNFSLLPPTKSTSQSSTSNTNEKYSFLRMAEQHLSPTIPPPQTIPNNASLPDDLYPSLPPRPQPLALSVNPVDASPATSTSSFGNAGPPPFPLCLLPQPALKQLIRSMAYGSGSRSNAGIQSSFGSWHNNITFTSELPPAPSSPLGSFCLHSPVKYITTGYPRPMNSSSAVVKKASHSSHNKRKHTAPTSAPSLISYPAYPTYSYQSAP